MSFTIKLIVVYICVAVVCVDKHGHVGAGVSTSGPPFKPPGRVGDSPLPGCGYYANDKVCEYVYRSRV